MLTYKSNRSKYLTEIGVDAFEEELEAVRDLKSSDATQYASEYYKIIGGSSEALIALLEESIKECKQIIIKGVKNVQG